MAESQNRPASAEQAPDPSFNYERAHPEREAGAGTLDHKTIGRATPAPTSDKIAGAVTNAQDPTRSFTAQDEVPPQPAAGQNAGGPRHARAGERRPLDEGRGAARLGSGADRHQQAPGPAAPPHGRRGRGRRTLGKTNWTAEAPGTRPVP